MKTFKINAGEIDVVLNDDRLVLKPTIRAATTISRQFNGFAEARRMLVAENFDSVVSVLRLGLNLSDNDARGRGLPPNHQSIEDRVYQNGITAELLIPLIKYVAVLGNGGRPLPDEPEDSAGNEMSEIQEKNG